MNSEFKPNPALRERAERLASRLTVQPDSLSLNELAHLIHELQVHQIELDLQNEELRNVQRELQVSRDQFFMLFYKAPIGYLVLDEVGLINQANEAFLRMIGRNAGQVIGKSVAEWIAPEDQMIFWGRYKAVFKQPAGKQLEVRLLKPDGGTFYGRVEWATFSKTATPSAFDRTQLLMTVSDISELKEAESNLRYLGTHDALTGLFNRAFFDAELERLKHERYFPVSVLFADLNDLKKVNDQSGHLAGDRLLQRAAAAFRETLRGGDILARIGGDEYGILLPATDEESVKNLLKRLRHRLAADNLSMAIGYSTAHEVTGLSKALHQADDAMYLDKSDYRRGTGTLRGLPEHDDHDHHI